MITASASGVPQQIIVAAVWLSGVIAGLVFFLRRIRRAKRLPLSFDRDGK